MHGCMQHVDNAHPNWSAGRPPSHTPGEMIILIIINVGEVEEGRGRSRDRGANWNVRESTFHYEPLV